MIASNELWQTAGWTMLHFLWIGTIVGLLGVVLRPILRRRSANVRYAAAVLVLLVLAVLPVGIAVWLVKNSPNSLPIGGVSENVTHLASIESANTAQLNDEIIELAGREPSPSEMPLPVVAENAATVDPTFTYPRKIPLEIVETAVPYLPWVWLVGTPLHSCC